MRLLLLVVLLCSGCARYEIKAPVIDHTDSFEQMAITDLKSLPLSAVPKPRKIEYGDDQLYAFTEQDIKIVFEIMQDAERNTDVLTEILKSYNYLVSERNNLVLVSKALQEHSNKLAIEWAKTEGGRRKAEDRKALEIAIYQVLILLGISLAL